MKYLPHTAEDVRKNPQCFDAKGRPWVEGEIIDIRRIGYLIIAGGGLTLSALFGGAFALLFWLRAS